MLRCLEYSMTQSRRKHTDSDSDSADSLFITQKPTPDAVRSGRRRSDGLLSNLTLPEDGEESRTSCPRTVKKQRLKKFELPKYTFPFLAKGRRRRPRGILLPLWNKTLNNFVMGGFFKCVRELQEGYKGEDDEDYPLPTVDMEGDYISPLPEREEMSVDEDIRVVEKRCFVKPSKRIRRQTWCTRLTQQRSQRVGDAGQETSPGAQNEMSSETPAEASISRAAPLSLNTASSVDGGSSCSVLMERNEEHMTNDRNLLAPKETCKTKTHHTQTCRNTTEEEELSNVSVCEPGEVHRGPMQSTQKDEEGTADPLNDALYMDDLSQITLVEDELESRSIHRCVPDLLSNTEDGVCSDRDPECAEDGKDQSQGEPDGLHVAKAVNAKVQETPSMSEDGRSVKNLSGDAAVTRQEKGDIPDSKQKKKKSTKSASEHFRQEVNGNLESGESMEDSMLSVSCNPESVVKKKEKKRKRRDEDAEQSQSSTAVECLHDDAETRRNKKRRKKEGTVIVGEECEEKEASSKTSDVPPMSTEQFKESSAGFKNTAPFEETLESSHVEIKQHKKKRQSSSMDVCQDREEAVGESLSNDAGALNEGTGKKKKKKKKRRFEEGLDPLQSRTATDPLNDDPETQTKKGKRKKEEKCEEKEASDRTSDLPLLSKEQFEQSVNGLENTGTLDRGEVKRKKHKKRQQSFSVDVSQDREEGVGVNFSSDAGSSKEVTGTPLKKKKKKKRKKHGEDVDP